jgi:hypothetical protein
MLMWCAGFKPNMYRLMQTTGKTLEMAVNFTKLFHAKRNRKIPSIGSLIFVYMLDDGVAFLC